ncbi:molybdopterin molybdotransferase MoeA [Caminibacter mediatlanticus TB-2]|uniref:Molybdopterin molybdenumtransferase n=1 Tax=Caminibacter mediatlanticus TB-2 TaxID=391592 RepID=A0AAI9AIA8_9BACT|nr:molybdopterin molybdotransferase MoeA [Caminibacter mediatlanticus]EDM24045.1 moea protein [Caminibacter mediatlanticus TB-2]QCT94406.1 molybdopterin molybdotransferase MoeA [Caminibacter mediatlanticus TB-2]
MELDKISFEVALNLCLENAKNIEIKESVFINEALGRFLAEDIYAKRNSPAFSNSAMDGFGFKYSNNKKFKIIKTIYAGDKFDDFEIKDDECVKIMTGAKIPKDVNTVIPIENCIEVNDEYIVIPEIKKGANIRIKGEEVKKGELLLEKGEEITPEVIALLVREGITNIKVYKKIKIAILSTGNELKEPFEIASEDEVYNINSYSVSALFKKHNFEVDLVGIVGDDLEETIKEISKLKDSYDVIISSGGISFGEKDYLYAAFIENGLKPFFHGILVKPGRPTMAGIMDKTFVFSLPGNPLSAFINAFALAIPTLRKIAGARKYYFNYVLAKNEESFKVNPKKDHTILGFLNAGKFKVYEKYKYGSGMLKPLFYSNSLVLLNKGRDFIDAAEVLKVIPFNSDFVEFSNPFN